ncbi:hypothetical protein BH11ARM2_BH11ARM2_28790 [soil metagenome]
MQFTQEDEYRRKSRLSRIFPTKTDGKAFLHGLRRGARIEVARKERVLTLGAWFDWLAQNDWPESLDEKTVAARLGRFDRHVRPVLGGFPLAKIDPLLVRSFYRELRDGGVGEATVHAVKANLVRAYNQAVTPYGRVPMTQANQFRLTLRSAGLREAVALTPERARYAVACPDLTPKERAMLAAYLYAGLRLSEQMALSREQLGFDQGLIAVDRSVKLDPRDSQSIGLPKGNKKRLAVMCPSLAEILRPVCQGLGPDGLLWPAESANKPKMKKRTYDVWKAIIGKTGLPSEMSPHDCRLTHVNWIEKLLPDVRPLLRKNAWGTPLAAR